MVCPPRAAVLGSRTRVDAYNRSITKPLTGEPDAGDPPVRFGGRGKVQSLVPTPIAQAPRTRECTLLRRPKAFQALDRGSLSPHSQQPMSRVQFIVRSEEHTSELQSLRHLV